MCSDTLVMTISEKSVLWSFTAVGMTMESKSVTLYGVDGEWSNIQISFDLSEKMLSRARYLQVRFIDVTNSALLPSFWPIVDLRPQN